VKKILVAALLSACATTPPRQEVAEAKPQGTPDADYRQEAPRPGAPVEFKAPVPRQLKLLNGLPVYLVERHEVPLVSVVLALRSGADTEPRGKAGLASLALDLLDEGTPTRDAAAIAREFEDLAARYRTQADADASGVGVTALAGTLDKVLEIFSDVVLHPVFRDADVERVRVERLGAIAQTLDDPAAVGQHVLSRVLFGEQHPWAFPAEGTVDSVKSITRKDLVAWHEAHFRPANAALFVVGDIEEAALMPLLERSFGAWKGSRPPAPPVRKTAPASERVIYVVDKPDAPQSQIWIGEIGVSSIAADIFPVRVMNNILGGSFNSRLNGNLRTEHAYSYGVFSFFDTHREAGPFAAAGGVVSDKTAEALGEFIKELRKMKSGEVSDAELSDARESLIRAIPALFSSDDATAVAYARAWAHDLPADYYATYQERVQAVGKEEVAKAARERLHPEAMAIVVVGPRKAIEEKIAALKLGKVELRDANGEALEAAKAAAKAGK
jgi:zinc protease